MRRAVRRSSLRSCARAESVYSTLQGKFGFHIRGRMQAFLPLPDALEHVAGEVVVLQVVNAVFDQLAQIKGLGAPGLGSEEAEPFLGFCGQADRGRQVTSLYRW